MSPIMPLTGVATFARAPYAPDPAAVGARYAVLGVPFDAAVGYRPGQRLAPRAVRDASTRYALPWGPDNPGYFDVETGETYLRGVTLADAGDADPLYTDLEHLDRSVAEAVGRILRAGAVPVALGGDHSVTYPLIRALAPLFEAGGAHAGERLVIVQLDAHLDFSDDVAGFRRANSCPIRRAVELPFVGDVAVIGVRGIRTNPEAWEAARARGHRIVLARDLTQRGGTAAGEYLAPALAALRSLPAGAPAYITLDIDVLDPSVAPGTSSPEPDGLRYGDVRLLIREAARHLRVVAADVVEINPYLDVGNVTSLLGARAVVELVAAVEAARRDGA